MALLTGCGGGGGGESNGTAPVFRSAQCFSSISNTWNGMLGFSSNSGEIKYQVNIYDQDLDITEMTITYYPDDQTDLPPYKIEKIQLPQQTTAEYSFESTLQIESTPANQYTIFFQAKDAAGNQSQYDIKSSDSYNFGFIAQYWAY